MEKKKTAGFGNWARRGCNFRDGKRIKQTPQLPSLLMWQSYSGVAQKGDTGRGRQPPWVGVTEVEKAVRVCRKSNGQETAAQRKSICLQRASLEPSAECWPKNKWSLVKEPLEKLRSKSARSPHIGLRIVPTVSCFLFPTVKEKNQINRA